MEASFSSFTYVYLCSAPHSGSTLIACLMGAHPDISTVGEFGATVKPMAYCSCGLRYQNCPFWQQWACQARAMNIDFEIDNLGINLEPTQKSSIAESAFYYLFPNIYLNKFRDIFYKVLPKWDKDTKAATTKAISIAKLLCQIERTTVFFDSMKNPFQIRFLQSILGEKLKMIALIRDGRGVMNSLMVKEKMSPEQAIDTWLWSNRNLVRVAQYLSPENVLWLKYEDFCLQLQGNANILFNHCQVDSNVKLDYSDLKNRHIVGNGMRLNFTGEVKYDEVWRQSLTTSHIQSFEKKAGWLNRYFGYSD